MYRLFLSIIVVASLLPSCSPNQHIKQVFILSNGKFKVDADQKKITVDPSNTHTEETWSFNSPDKVVITVSSPAGEKTLELPDDGSYVLNLKVDTLTGGIVNYGSSGKPTSMSGEQFDRMIDSTQQLIEGKNASDDKKTYFIPPSSIKKISSASSVRVIGPYKGIPYSLDVDASGKAPEVYKFFTNKQQRESLDDLKKRMTDKK